MKNIPTSGDISSNESKNLTKTLSRIIVVVDVELQFEGFLNEIQVVYVSHGGEDKKVVACNWGDIKCAKKIAEVENGQRIMMSCKKLVVKYWGFIIHS